MFAPQYDYVDEAEEEAEFEAQIIRNRFIAIVVKNFKLKRIKQNSQKRKVKRFLLGIVKKQILINNRNKIFQYVNYLKKYYGYQFIYKNNYNYWKSFYRKKLQLQIEFYNNNIKTQFLKNIFDVNLINNLINYNSDKIEKPKEYCEVLYCLEPKLPKFRVCEKHKCIVKSCPFVKHRKTVDHEPDTLLSNYKPNLEKFEYINNNYTDIIKHFKRKPLTYLKEGEFNIYNDTEKRVQINNNIIVLPKHFYLKITKNEVQKNKFFDKFFIYNIEKYILETDIENTNKDFKKFEIDIEPYLDEEFPTRSLEERGEFDLYKYDEEKEELEFNNDDLNQFKYDEGTLEDVLVNNIINILFYKLNGKVGFDLKNFINDKYPTFYKNITINEKEYPDIVLPLTTADFAEDSDGVIYEIDSDGDDVEPELIVDGYIFIFNDKIRKIFYSQAEENTTTNFYKNIKILVNAFKKQKLLINRLKNKFISKIKDVKKLQVLYTICFDLIFDYINYVGIEMLNKFINTWTLSLKYSYTFTISFYEEDVLKIIKKSYLKNQRNVWDEYLIIDQTFVKSNKLNTIKNLRIQNYSNLYISKVMNITNDFTNVVKLNLSKNSIKDVNFLKSYNLPNLETLDLSYNNLNFFEINLEAYSNLKTIYCQNNKIEDVQIFRNINKQKNESVKNIFLNFESNNIEYISILKFTLSETENRFKYKISNDKKKVNLKFSGTVFNSEIQYEYNKVAINGDVYVNLYMNLNNNNLTFEEVYKLLFLYYTSAYIYGKKVLGKSQFLPIIFTCENNKITSENKRFLKDQMEYYLNNVENSAIFKQKEVGKLLNFIRKSEETYNIKDNEKVVPFKNGLFSNFNKSKSLKLNTSKGFNYCIRHMRVALKEQPEFFDINNNLKFFTLKDIFSNKFDDYYKINIILDYMMKYNRIEEDELERKYKNDVEWYKKYKKQINEFIFTYLN